MTDRDRDVKERIADALVTLELVADVAMAAPALPPPVAPQLGQTRGAESALVTEAAPSASRLVEQAADHLEQEHERLRGSIRSANGLAPLVVHDPLARARKRESHRTSSAPKRSK